MAAVLTVPSSTLGIRSAGAHLGMRPHAGIHELLVGRGRSRRRDDIAIYRVTHLHPADVEIVDGIPTTTWARTTLDLAAVLRSGLTKLITRTEQLGIFDRRTLDEAIARAPRHRGIAPLLAALDAMHPDIALTDSHLEIAMAELTDAHGLPRAVFQRPLLGHRVDFCWPDARLVVETDGWETHRTRKAFQDDRTHDRALQLAGFRVLRFTWDDLTLRADAVAADLRLALEG
jgi:very-short-patch-repair endonuclease